MKFTVTLTTEVEIDLDQKVIDQVDDEWRSMFYNLHTPEDIAEHIGFNLVVNNASLTMLDGWADLSDDMVRVNNDFDWEVEVVKKD